MSGNQIQLQDWEPTKSSNKQASKEIWDKINALKLKKDYKQILEIANNMQNNLQAYLIRAKANLSLKRYQQTIRCCNNGLQLGQESQLWNLKGKAIGKLGNQQEKIQFIKCAIEINPNVASYYRNIGAAYYLLKQYQTALHYHQKAISLQSKNPINYHNKGAALLRLKKPEEALENFNKTLNLNPKLSLTYSWRGDCYKELGNYKLAIQNYSKAYQLSENEIYLKQKRKVEEMAGIKSDKKKGFFSIFGF